MITPNSEYADWVLTWLVSQIPCHPDVALPDNTEQSGTTLPSIIVPIPIMIATAMNAPTSAMIVPDSGMMV